MRITVTIDDDLFEKARADADKNISRAALCREAIRLFVRMQAAKRLAALGGAQANMKKISRQRAVCKTHSNTPNKTT